MNSLITLSDCPTMMHRRSILVILLSIFAHFLWCLDANPLLFLYDMYLTRIIATTHHLSNIFIDGNIKGNRRIFPSDSIPSLEGKTIWITGASSGIGTELALQLASVRPNHLILSGRNQDKLQSVAKACRDAAFQVDGIEMKMKVSIVPFDMSGGPEILDDAVSTALDEADDSGIDILILNAGQYQCSPALDTNLDEAIPHLMQVNFESPVILSQKLIQRDHWKERGYGYIVAVSSLMGRGASPLNAVYSSTKHALQGYFHSLAAEERSWLRVDVVLPGATDTNLWNGSSTRGIIVSNPNNDKLQSGRTPHADERSKMSVERCAQLIVSSMIGPNSIMFETWITRNPGLLWVFLASYEPMTFQLLTNVIAPFRMDMWRKYGEDALYLPTLLLHMWKCMLDYVRGLY